MVPGRDCIWSRLIKHLCGALLGALLLHGQAVAADPGARAVVADLNAALLESMQSARELGYEGPYRLPEPGSNVSEILGIRIERSLYSRHPMGSLTIVKPPM